MEWLPQACALCLAYGDGGYDSKKSFVPERSLSFLDLYSKLHFS